MAGSGSEKRETWRLFLAVEVDPAILHMVQEQIRQLQPLDDGQIKWASEENMHLTLVFLGSVAAEDVRKIEAASSEVAKMFSPFLLSLDSWGGFPNLAHPRVLWVGLKGATDVLKQLVQKLEERLRPLGFESEDRPFHPHLTTGRIRSDKARLNRLLEKLKQIVLPANLEIKVSHFILFRSVLGPKGPVYSRLRAFELKQSFEQSN